MSGTFTPRQLRERDYYDRFAQEHASLDVSFDPIKGSERRPWNTYWRLIELVQAEYRSGGRMLDFGCGWGTNTVLFAAVGYEVHGFDISEKNIQTARSLAEQHGVGHRVHLKVQTAEQQDYPDNFFDVIAGVDILHHVDIERSMKECRRILKPGGKAFFREPLYSPVFDTIRNSRPIRRLFPNEASFEKHITDDERKLSRADIEVIRREFPVLDVEYSRVMSRLAVLSPSRIMTLEKLDHMLRKMPGMKSLSGYAVLAATKD